MAALKSGDSVQFKNRTGQIMTIEKMERVDGLDIAFCRWFESTTQERHDVIVLLETLERVRGVA
jgi:hypothetical protein